MTDNDTKPMYCLILDNGQELTAADDHLHSTMAGHKMTEEIIEEMGKSLHCAASFLITGEVLGVPIYKHILTINPVGQQYFFA